MPTGKITKRSVDALKTDLSNRSDPTKKYPKGRIKDVYLWDSEFPGFAVKATGETTKTYLFQYRDKTKRTRRVTIGHHGRPWTPDKARDEAEKIAAEIRLGGDPAKSKSDREVLTVNQIADAFLQDHVDAKRKHRTAKEYRRLLTKRVLPKLGRLAIEDIDRADVARLHQSMRKTPYDANRALAVLSSMFTWAIRHGEYAGNNPCLLIERYKEKKNERFLSPSELAQLGEVLARHESDTPVGVAAIRFLVLTGMRKNECLTLKWDEVSFESATVHLSDSKTGAKSIPMSAPALEVLSGMSELSQDGNPYVFVGKKNGGHLINLQKIWTRLRIEAGLEDVRIHDFRHSFASVGASSGDSLVILGSILGHANAATTARYAHLHQDPRKAAAERIAGQISASMNGKPEADLLPFKRSS